MFGLIRRVLDPPTANQVRYAKQLGIPWAAWLSKKDISNAIDRATAPEREARMQTMHSKKESKAKERREKLTGTFGQAKVADLDEWESFCNGSDYVLTIYKKRGGGRGIEVYCFESVSFDERGKLKLAATRPKKYREDGETYLEWDSDATVDVSSILHCEALPENLTGCDMGEYEAVISRGQEIASRLPA